MEKITLKTFKNTIQISNSKDTVEIMCGNVLEEKEYLTFGLYGIVQIKGNSYLLFISKVIQKESIKGHDVYEITGIDIIHLNGEDRSKIDHLKDFFRLPGIYFSSYPLYKNKSISSSDGRDFIFNFTPLQNLEESYESLAQFGVKCILGFYSSKMVNGLSVCMISRRSWRRIGSRYFSRGASFQGHVSNFVETEFFMINDDKEVSYLQVRGSIPLIWSHDVSIPYSPTLKIDKNDSFVECNELMTERYSKVFYLNLIKDTGYEKAICEKFTEKLITNKLPFLHYDVHNRGKLSNPELQTKFINSIKNVLDNYGFKTSESFQKGVVRTNCIDCLDRTNLCQFLISQYNLKKMSKFFKDVDFQRLESLHRRMWYDNGNNLSIQYSGTPAISSHVVAGDQVKMFGPVADFYKSLLRYFLNRFSHGRLQDNYEILTIKDRDKGKKKFRNPPFLSLRLLYFIFILFGLLSVSRYYLLGFNLLVRVFQAMCLLICCYLVLFYFYRDYPEYEDKQ